MAREESSSDDRFVVAFYGVEQSERAAAGFFECVVEWITNLGYPPDKLKISGAGHTGKPGEYRRRLSELRKSGFSVVDALSLHASLPGARFAVSDYSAAATFSRNPSVGLYAVAAVPSGHACKSVWLPIARHLANVLQPAYGIGFEQPLSQGPVFYALGINFSRISEFEVAIGDEYDRRRSISRWSNLGMGEEVYRQGLLRYVYRWNFLTRPQLDRPVEGSTLAEWINDDPQRGTLEALAGDVSLWEVEESQLAPIRNRLHDANAIFDWRKYRNIEPHIKTVLG